MAILTKQNKLGRIVAIFICLLIVLPACRYFLIKNQNQTLLQNVKSVVQEEYNKIQLSGLQFEEKNAPDSSCDYDHKVRATRCNIDYTKYYVTDENLVEEFLRIDKYLTDLGWKYYTRKPETKDILEGRLKRGFPPFEIYVKEAPYNLEMHMIFYGEKDRDFTSTNPKVIQLLDEYSGEGKSVYSISISSDII